MTKLSLRSLFPACFNDTGSRPQPRLRPRPRPPLIADLQGSPQRLSCSDISSPEDLSLSLVGSNLHVFTLNELKGATRGFSLSNLIGEGGFGPVYKGFIDDKIRKGIKAQAVAVKLLDLDGMQGHKEWLVNNHHQHFLFFSMYC